MKPIKINYRPTVPCFGNDPKTDLELLRRINQQPPTYNHFIIIIAGLILVSIVSSIIALIY
tara:strand:+ start:222 stop:404 length:183 start_codon:yes stop_codon:yes gene_type:complete